MAKNVNITSTPSRARIYCSTPSGWERCKLKYYSGSGWSEIDYMTPADLTLTEDYQRKFFVLWPDGLTSYSKGIPSNTSTLHFSRDETIARMKKEGKSLPVEKPPESPVVRTQAVSLKANSICLPPPPDNYKPPFIAIWQLSPLLGVSKETMPALTETLRSSLVDSGWYNVIARGEMEKVLKEQDVSLSSTCDTTDCAVEYGQMLSVEKFVVGSVSKVGTTYQVVLKLINVSTGKIEKSGKARKPGGEEVLLDLVDQAAVKMID